MDVAHNSCHHALNAAKGLSKIIYRSGAKAVKEQRVHKQFQCQRMKPIIVVIMRSPQPKGGE